MKIHYPNYDKYGYERHTKKYLDLEKLFKETVKGRNFFTPRIVGYVETQNGVIEISSGKMPFVGNSNKFYGITVVINGENKKELSTAVHSMDAVMEYIKSLT